MLEIRLNNIFFPDSNELRQPIIDKIHKQENCQMVRSSTERIRMGDSVENNWVTAFYQAVRRKQVTRTGFLEGERNPGSASST